MHAKANTFLALNADNSGGPLPDVGRVTADIACHVIDPRVEPSPRHGVTVEIEKQGFESHVDNVAGNICQALDVGARFRAVVDKFPKLRAMLSKSESLQKIIATPGQGLTLVHFSAQRKRFLWDGGSV